MFMSGITVEVPSCNIIIPTMSAKVWEQPVITVVKYFTKGIIAVIAEILKLQ